MNRRTLFKAVAAALLVPLLPKPAPQPKPVTMALVLKNVRAGKIVDGIAPVTFEYEWVRA